MRQSHAEVKAGSGSGSGSGCSMQVQRWQLPIPCCPATCCFALTKVAQTMHVKTWQSLVKASEGGAVHCAVNLLRYNQRLLQPAHCCFRTAVTSAQRSSVCTSKPC